MTLTTIGGGTDQEIGASLHISERTVRNHVYNIQNKTKTENRIQLVVLGLQNQWIQLKLPI
ncbi:response regulator transcription factor [bacterium LRH843]|nr:response regulator transcription factor [bacterium LRH843]